MTRGRAPALPLGRHARAALIATALASVGAAEACTPRDTPTEVTPPSAPPDGNALVAAYGAPMPPPALDASAPPLTTPDAASAPPPTPAASDASAPPMDAGAKPIPHPTMAVPAYGMPPRVQQTNPPPSHAPVSAYGGPPLGPGVPKP